MTISFGTSVGNLFPRLGKVGALLTNMRSYQATQLQTMTNTTTGVVAQFNAESDIQALMGSSYIGILNNVGSIGTTTQNIGVATINRMVFRDSPRLNQTLQQITLSQSIQYVINQMQQANATILAMNVAASSASFIGAGNGIVTCSVKRPFDGRVLENSFAEIVQITCTADSYTGNAQVGNESMTITGTGSTDLFNFDWPLGSNATIDINAIDGNTNNGAGNLLSGSNFSTWTNGLPKYFYPVVGGSTIHQETGITYDGNACMQVVGDGTTLTQIRQQFGSNLSATNAAGTPATLSSLTQYSFNIFLRRDGTAGTGTLVIDLVDVNNVVIKDQNNVANTFSVNLASLNTVFTSFTGIFRTPEALPTTFYLRIRLTTAYTIGQSFYMAKASMGVMNQLYTSGPFFACHSGSNPFQSGDYELTTITNSRGAGGTLSTFQTLLALLFAPTSFQQEFIFPSAALPSINDNLIA